MSSKNKSVIIRSPNSTRPWQHVLDIIYGYAKLAIKLNQNPKIHGEAFNFGPPEDHNYSVIDLINEMSKHWLDCKIEHPKLNQATLHEAGLLRLNCDKSRSLLKWSSTLTFQEMIKFTAEWYKQFYDNDKNNMRDISIRQINDYTYLARKKGIFWAQDE